MTYEAVATLFIALAAGGCDKGDGDGKNAAPSKDGEATSSAAKDEGDATNAGGWTGEKVVALAEGYAKAVCECEKPQCINEAGDKYHEDTNKLHEKGKPRNLTPEEKEKMDAAQAKARECTKKLLGK